MNIQSPEPMIPAFPPYFQIRLRVSATLRAAMIRLNRRLAMVIVAGTLSACASQQMREQVACPAPMAVNVKSTRCRAAPEKLLF